MNGEAFDDWLSLFDPIAEYVWLNEREELRKAAMAYHILCKELKRVQTNVEYDLKNLKVQLTEVDKRQEILQKSPRTPTISKEEKENTSPNVDSDLEGITCLQSQTPSLDILRYNFPANKSSMSCLKLNEKILEADESDEEIINDSVHSSPKIDRTRNIKTKKPSDSASFGNISLNTKDYSSPIASNYSNLDINFKTPKDPKRNSPDIFECTPDVKPKIKKLKASKLSMNNSGLKPKLLQKSHKSESTLTQLFSMPENKTSRKDFDDDETCIEEFRPEARDKFNNSKKMHYSQSNKAPQNPTAVVCEVNPNKKLKSSFALNYDKFPTREKKDEVNYVYKESVRGKEKQKLEGWSCKDCQKFYEGLDYPPEKMKAIMNNCSRHRSKFAPQCDTPPGFWDIGTMTTQD